MKELPRNVNTARQFESESIASYSWWGDHKTLCLSSWKSYLLSLLSFLFLRLDTDKWDTGQPASSVVSLLFYSPLRHYNPPAHSHSPTLTGRPVPDNKSYTYSHCHIKTVSRVSSRLAVMRRMLWGWRRHSFTSSIRWHTACRRKWRPENHAHMVRAHMYTPTLTESALFV